MNDLFYERLIFPELLYQAKHFKIEGTLALSLSGLVYLDIDDNYILELFPLLHTKYQEVARPDYFDMDAIGAHISAVYPEENRRIPDEELGKKYQFKIMGLYSVVLNNKKYYILLVNSPSLLIFRAKYGLPNQLKFKGYGIDLHITIGKVPLPST